MLGLVIVLASKLFNTELTTVNVKLRQQKIFIYKYLAGVRKTHQDTLNMVLVHNFPTVLNQGRLNCR